MTINLRKSSLVTLLVTTLLVFGVMVACLGWLYATGVPYQSLLIPLVGLVVVLPVALWMNLRARQQWLEALGHDAKLLAQMVGRRSGRHLNTELYIDELRPLSEVVQKERHKLIVLGLTDPLCDVGNRRALEQWLQTFFDRPETKAPVSVLLIDLDHFKDINDRYGHDMGDQVIKKFASELRNRVRECDLIARMGGDEFCIVFPQTRLSVAMALAGRLRTQLPISMEVTKGSLHTLQWTGGLSVTDPFDISFKEVLKRADRALLIAKNQGRNRTEIFELSHTADERKFQESFLH